MKEEYFEFSLFKALRFFIERALIKGDWKIISIDDARDVVVVKR